MDDTLIELDDRRRASLGKVGHPEHRRYLAHEEADGTVILRPAVVMTEAQARFWANPQLVERIQQGMDDPSRWGKRRGRLQRGS